MVWGGGGWTVFGVHIIYIYIIYTHFTWICLSNALWFQYCTPPCNVEYIEYNGCIWSGGEVVGLFLLYTLYIYIY